MKNMNQNISIEIDHKSGFCFGVVNAIRKAEDALQEGVDLYCLGDIVHNNMEVTRLEKLGLKTIDIPTFKTLSEKTVLLRAHGEPPTTYAKAQKNHTKIIDATCPVVLRLQRSVRKAHDKSLHDNGQVVIYGKIGHAEVNGLVGQTENKAIVIQSLEDTSNVDLTRPVNLFSQTTMMVDKYLEIIDFFENKMSKDKLEVFNTVCKQVSGRIEELRKFCKKKDIVIFVSGKKSSNGKALFSECLKANNRSYLVADETDVKKEWLINASKIGICGATSTPNWLMKKVGEHIENL